MNDFIDHKFEWSTFSIPILKSLFIPQGQIISFDGYCMMHHEDYIPFASSLQAWDSALDALKELMHYKIDSGVYFRN